MARDPTSRIVSYSLLGGLVGALVMGAIAYMMPIPNTGGAPFFVAAAMLMGMGSMSWVAGWVLHLTTGLVVGGIFGFVVAKVSRLQFRTTGRAIGLGVLAGFVMWMVFFMPMMAMLMPTLMSMSMLVGGSLVAHLVFGLALGGVASVAIPKSGSFRCPACGAPFTTQDELTDHKAKAHPM
jgi:hypothetical protein